MSSQIITKDHGVYLTEQQTTLGIDTFEIDESVNYLIFTHLQEETLNFLTTKSCEIPVYLSQNLYWLLQKLVRFKFIAPLSITCHVLPYSYQVRLGNFKVTAFNSDDGLYGAIALLIENQKQQKIGYSGALSSIGAHKKRLKTWKKALHDSQLDVLLVDNALQADKHDNLSEVNLQKALLKLLTQQTTPISAIFSPWNPERLYRYHQTALSVGWKIIFAKNYANLLHALYPFETFYVSFDSTQENLKQIPVTSKTILQQTKFDTATVQFVDPVIEDYLHNTRLDAYLQTDLIGLGRAEFNELIRYLDAAAVYYYH